jgi:hypothetical protein
VRPALRRPVLRAAAALAVAVTVALGVALGERPAAAGGLDFDLVGARAIGRAGATTVSGDGGSALVTNPAGLARSGSLRLQLGAVLHDDDASFRAPGSGATNSPTASDGSAPALAPSISLQGALGPVVLGAALLELGHFERVLPAPAFNQGPDDVIRLFPHRYGGLEVSYRRRVAVAGAAIRVGDWLGLGLSIGGSDVEAGERRRIWAGFDGRDPLANPIRDLDLELAGRDRLVPFAAAGVLVAPPPLPLELAASLSWSADAFLDGDVALGKTSDESYPEPFLGGDEPAADVRIGMPTTLRAGLRYLGERILVEVGGDLTWYREAGKVPAWSVTGVGVRDQTGRTAMILDVPSLLAQRDHAEVRGAVDVEIVSGLLWLTGGYAYATGGTGRAHLSPGFGDIAGHTLALGAEGSWNQITLALGVARRISKSVTLAENESEVEMENPFDAGSATAGAGRHARGHDAVGLTMEVAWE